MLKNICPKEKAKKQKELTQNSFKISLFDTVHDVPVKEWNALTENNLFLQIPYLKVLQEQVPGNMKFRYAVINKENKAVACAYFQLIELSGESIANMNAKEDENSCPVNVKQNFKKLLRNNADKVSFKILICGNSFISGEHGFIFSKDISAKEAFEQLAGTVNLITDSAKSKDKISAILVKDFYEESSAGILDKFKYHSFSVEPNMILKFKNNWKNFDDYLAAMSTKYRTRTKSILKKGSAVTSKKMDVGEIEKHKNEINILYDAVHSKAKFRIAKLDADYFSELKKTIGDKFTFTGYFLKDKLVAFRTSFLLNDILEAHFIGLDYKLNKELDLYQNILYDYIKEAFENNLSSVYFGRTASEIKSTVGAVAYNLTCYIRHRNTFSNAIIKPFIEYLQPSEWVPRSPFKEEKHVRKVSEAIS